LCVCVIVWLCDCVCVCVCVCVCDCVCVIMAKLNFLDLSHAGDRQQQRRSYTNKALKGSWVILSLICEQV
jgi:hypothetical protein